MTQEVFSNSLADPDVLCSHKLFAKFLLVSNVSKFTLDLYPSDFVLMSSSIIVLSPCHIPECIYRVII